MNMKTKLGSRIFSKLGLLGPSS